MELYFLRHGAAAPRADWEGDDAQRPLTEQGREEVARMAGSSRPDRHPPSTPSSPAHTCAPARPPRSSRNISICRIKWSQTTDSRQGSTRAVSASLLKKFPEAQGTAAGGPRA